MRNPLPATAIAGAMLLAGCGHASGEADGGATVSRNYNVSGFNQVEVGGSYDVEIRPGAKINVSASGPEKLLEHTLVEVRDGKLVIRPSRKNGMSVFGNGTRGSARFSITMPEIVAAATAGSGDIRVEQARGQQFEAAVGGSGGIEVANLDVQAFKASIGGSGSVKAAGKAQSADYEIGGSGEIDAGGVATDQARVSIAGSGSVEANAKTAADVSIMGSGDVKVSGGAKCNVSKAGSGNVDCS